eukprot:6403707-Prymnesium_polylepis.2
MLARRDTSPVCVRTCTRARVRACMPRGVSAARSSGDRLPHRSRAGCSRASTWAWARCGRTILRTSWLPWQTRRRSTMGAWI